LSFLQAKHVTPFDRDWFRPDLQRKRVLPDRLQKQTLFTQYLSGPEGFWRMLCGFWQLSALSYALPEPGEKFFSGLSYILGINKLYDEGFF